MAEPVTNLDQTFQSDSTFAGLGGSGMAEASGDHMGDPMNAQMQQHVPGYDDQSYGQQQLADDTYEQNYDDGLMSGN